MAAAFFVVVGRVAGAGVRRDERAFGAVQHLVQQPAVLLLADLVFDQPGLPQIDLVGELQAAGVGDRPHGAAGRGQRGHHLVEHRVVEIGRRDLAPRELGDLLDQPLDLALGALDLLGVHREPERSLPEV